MGKKSQRTKTALCETKTKTKDEHQMDVICHKRQSIQQDKQFPEIKNSCRYNEPVCRNWPIDHLPNALSNSNKDIHFIFSNSARKCVVHGCLW
jgi:hypothetical protein